MLVHIPASLLIVAVAGQIIVGNALIVTSTVISAPGQPDGEVELITYSTTALVLPVFTSTSVIWLVHPPGQSAFPVALPLITDDVQVKSVKLTVELIVSLAAAPLKIVVLAADAIGVAPIVSVIV